MGISFFVILATCDRLEGLFAFLTLITLVYGACGLVVYFSGHSLDEDIRCYNKAKAEAVVLESGIDVPYSLFVAYMDDIEKANKMVEKSVRWKGHPYMGAYYNEETASFGKVVCDSVGVHIVPDEEYFKN